MGALAWSPRLLSASYEVHEGIAEMTEVVLFHHVQGLTDGIRAFAEELRGGGHTVHTPDLFGGERPASIDDGVALVQSIGKDVLSERAGRAVADLPGGLVYAGFSFGAGRAQRLSQTRPGVRGALLYESCLPISGDWAVGPWPDGVPVQIHGMDKDPFFALEGDIDAARELVATVGSELAELFVYPGDRHLFTDSSLPSYDPDAARLVLQRSREFLERVG
jgi:dienelactone hydrolase